MKLKTYETGNTASNTEIQIISKSGTVLKCSIFLLVLSIGMCLLENVELTSVLSNLIKF